MTLSGSRIYKLILGVHKGNIYYSCRKINDGCTFQYVVVRVSARGEHHVVVRHAVVQRDEGAAPARDGGGAGGAAGGGYGRSDQAQRGRAEHSTDGSHWTDVGVGEHLQQVSLSVCTVSLPYKEVNSIWINSSSCLCSL